MHPNIDRFILNHYSHFPNNPRLPALIYRAAVARHLGDLDDLFEQTFTRNGWKGAWRNGVYSFHHYHSNAHEVLGVASGSATIQLGGPVGPKIEVTAGDVLIMPAGTAHKRVKSTKNFDVVGAYPAGQENFDTIRSDGDTGKAIVTIASVPLPKKDPVYGAHGPLLELWGNP